MSGGAENMSNASEGTQMGNLFSTFHVGGLYFGVDVLQVQEVLRYHEMTPVPLAPSVVEGLINLRGQIVTAIDMRRRLKLDPRPEGQNPVNMVIRAEDGAVSLLVDSIGDVVQVEAATHESPPSTMNPLHRELVTAVYKLDGKLLLALDTAKALKIDAKS
jgi:purine-binding chemotaxis protein CheW